MNKKLNKRELAQIEFHFQTTNEGYYLFRDSFDTISEELKDLAFEHAIMGAHGAYLISTCFDKLTPDQKEKAFKNAIEYNRGYDIFKNCFDKLTPDQREEAFENAIKNNRGSHIFEFIFYKLSEHQKLIALENALDNYTFEEIITEDGHVIKNYSIFFNFPNVKDYIKEMIYSLKKKEENNE